MIKSRNIELDKALVNKTSNFLAPTISPKATVTASAATATLATTAFGGITTNTGAGAGIVLTLPSAIAVGTKGLRVAITVAQTVTLTPATGEKIYLNGSGVASKYLLIAGVIGNYVNLYSDGTDYIVTGYNGVVTKEA